MLHLFLTQASCWWGHPHMIIARTAEKLLKKGFASQLLEAINFGAMPRTTVTDCSTWQDEVKNPYNFGRMGDWHFIDTPLNDGSFTGKFKSPTYNVTCYLNDAWDSLNDPTTTDKWIWAFHLRSIIHFVGDVHTPHHCIARYGNQWKSGDSGGNGFGLNCPYGSACNNMHFLWDSCGLKYNIYYPTVPALMDAFEKNVTSINKEFPSINGQDETTWNPHGWSAESYDVAKTYGYETPLNGFPSDEYFKTVQREGSKRITTSGRRLGNVLNHLLALKNFPKYDQPSRAREISIWVIDSILGVTSIVVTVLTFLSSKKSARYEERL